MIVYIGAIEGDGLTVATADPATGGLTVTDTLADVREPSFLAMRGTTLYAVVEEPEGAVTELDIADPAAPKVRRVVATGQAGPTHLCLHGDHLAVAHYTDGTVTIHDLDTLAVTDRLRHDADEPHAHQVVSRGDWLVAVDLGADAVLTHRVDNGRITQHARCDLPKGTGPRHLAFHGDTAAYVLGEYIPGVTRLAWDAGAFTVTGHHLVTAPGAPETFPAEIIAADTHLYTSNRGENVIARLDLDGTLRQSVPVGGDWPRHCAVDPTGRWLYVANQRSHNVTWLPRDPATGELGEPVGSVTVRGACMVAFA
ncbi:lactonase family protein [Actinokineospora sp. UTMC 2448]|uniref:lactonase family protein n=1 Tax=Actinokineospora sp. UTMC 2448 TaxID=2268449 RepID=UPI002164D836|nr:lactonase family protein [Actinokineospora sp. UTMC 2448]UVS78975.1 6-phosphogluconolactonase [Actinokineospora sp. UTMC 2448]